MTGVNIFTPLDGYLKTLLRTGGLHITTTLQVRANHKRRISHLAPSRTSKNPSRNRRLAAQVKIPAAAREFVIDSITSELDDVFV